MEEVRRGLVAYDVPAANAGTAGVAGLAGMPSLESER